MCFGEVEKDRPRRIHSLEGGPCQRVKANQGQIDEGSIRNQWRITARHRTPLSTRVPAQHGPARTDDLPGKARPGPAGPAEPSESLGKQFEPPPAFRPLPGSRPFRRWQMVSNTIWRGLRIVRVIPSSTSFPYPSYSLIRVVLLSETRLLHGSSGPPAWPPGFDACRAGPPGR